MERGALVTDCGNYRYSLTRTWDESLPELGWIMLNPSTADTSEDDPTIRRCMAFAMSDGYGGIRVENLFAYRATDPLRLIQMGVARFDVVGPSNDSYIQRLFHTSARVVAAWGVPKTGFIRRRASTMELARALIAVERRARDAMIIDDRGRVVVLFAEGGAV